MITYAHILSEQVTKLAESSSEQFYETLTSLAQDVLRAYGFERLSLIPNSPVLLSQGDFFTTSIAGQKSFAFSEYGIRDFERYIQVLDRVEDYLAFNHFDIQFADSEPLALLREVGVKSHCVIPISASGQIWGALTLSSFVRLDFDWEKSKIVSELKAIGNLWLCFWQRACVLQAHDQNGGAFLIEEREKLLALPNKQREVLTLLGKGLTAQQCAETMFISRRTVESHKYRMLKTLGMKNHTELVQLIKRHHIDAG